MASNTKEIKERINSIKNSRQITNAMNIVSSTKFKKFQTLTFKSRAYSDALDVVFENILGSVVGQNHILFDGKKNVKKVCLIVMSSDRGLCGSFNSNALKRMENMINKFTKEGKSVSVISIGKKARDYCDARNVNVDSEYIQLIPETMFEKAKTISLDIVNNYLSDNYDEVYLISCVIFACLILLYSNVNCFINSSALSLAFFIAIILAECSLAVVSSNA